MSQSAKTADEHQPKEKTDSLARNEEKQSVLVKRGPHLRQLKKVKNVLTRMESMFDSIIALQFVLLRSVHFNAFSLESGRSPSHSLQRSMFLTSL